PNCADYRISTEGVEMGSGGQGRCDFGRSDDGSQRATVSDTFGHGHDIGNYILGLKSPVMSAGAAKSGLDFIRDANTAGGANMLIRILQIAVGKYHAATHALDGFCDKCCDLPRG